LGAHVIKPNTKFNPDGEWTVEICNLDPTNKKIAESDGLKVKNQGDERGDFVTLKQYARTQEGIFRPMKVTDSQRNSFSSRQTCWKWFQG
jgi:hypothetical protein